jgi:hypothetical protein
MLADGTIGVETFSKAYHEMNAEAELAGLNAEEVDEYIGNISRMIVNRFGR